MADLEHLHNGVVITDVTTLRKLIDGAVRKALEERERPELRLLTAEEAGQRLGVSKETVLKWARRDGLPHRKLGGKEVRFLEAEIMAWGKVGRGVGLDGALRPLRRCGVSGVRIVCACGADLRGRSFFNRRGLTVGVLWTCTRSGCGARLAKGRVPERLRGAA